LSWARSGTIFLDEIRRLSRRNTRFRCYECFRSANLKRVGATGLFQPTFGHYRDQPRSVRCDRGGNIPADLFYRLKLPDPDAASPGTKEDIPMLVEYFVKTVCRKNGEAIRKIDKQTLELCQAYHWPGNIRELQNIIERSVDPLQWPHLFGSMLLALEPGPARLELSCPLSEPDQEKHLIEAA